jgi:O-antigen ligase
MNIKSGLNISVGVLLTFSMVLPTVLQPIKIGLLAASLFLSVIYLFGRNERFSSFVLIFGFFYVCIGLFWAFFGVLSGNPGAIPTMTVMVVYPLVLPLISFACNEEDKKKLNLLLVNLALLIGIFDIFFIASFLINSESIFANLVFDLYKHDAVIDVSETYFKFTIPNISSVLFLLPFTITFFLNGERYKARSFVAVVILFLVMILSGRRAGFIAPILGLSLAYLLTFKGLPVLDSRKLTSFFIVFIVLIIFFSILSESYYGFENYLNLIASIFDFQTNESNIERSLQFDALMKGIEVSPVFGHGPGAVADYTRSDVHAWGYELSYVAFVFHYGILGFILYAFGIMLLVWILVRLVRVNGKQSFEYPFLSGFISFMIANATNPYIAKFDYMWVIFIPVGIFNLWILRKIQQLRK